MGIAKGGVGPVLMLTAFITHAQTNEHVIKYRQATMKAIGGNMAAISLIIKNRFLPQQNLVEHAREIQGASTLIESAFEQEVSSGRTDALPKIWSDWESFLSIVKKMEEESGRLVEIGTSGDLKSITQQVKALARSCGKCHKRFRKPKAKSYKQ